MEKGCIWHVGGKDTHILLLVTGGQASNPFHRDSRYEHIYDAGSLSLYPLYTWHRCYTATQAVTDRKKRAGAMHSIEYLPFLSQMLEGMHASHRQTYMKCHVSQ